jgi:ribosomal protein S6--L-glutamate ligase
MKKSLHIILLTTSPAANKLLVETIEARGHRVTTINPARLYLYISEHPSGYDKLLLESDGDEPIRLHANSIDAVIPRLGSSVTWGSSCLRFLSENIGLYCYDSPWSHILAQDKSFTLQRLSSAGVRVPRTIICESLAHVSWAMGKLGTKIVIKTTHGSKGKTVAVVDNVKSASGIFEFLYNAGLKVILEEFIPCESTDYRVWVVGGKVAVSMKRTASDPDQWKANLSLGGTGSLVKLSDEDEALCIKAAESLGLGVCGVDLVKSSVSGLSYILEVNSNPGTLVVSATGHNVFEDVVKLVEDNCGASNNSQSMNQGNAKMKADLLFNPNLLGNIDHLIKVNNVLKEGIRYFGK